MSIDIKLPLGPFKDALATLFGAMFAFAIVSMLAAFIPALANDWHGYNVIDMILVFIFAWIGHWIIALMPFWGVPFGLLQVIALHSLIYGSRDRLFILCIAFANQSFVSSIAIYTLFRDSECWPALCAGIVCLSLSGAAIWRMHRNGFSRAAM